MCWPAVDVLDLCLLRCLGVFLSAVFLRWLRTCMAPRLSRLEHCWRCSLTNDKAIPLMIANPDQWEAMLAVIGVKIGGADGGSLH